MNLVLIKLYHTHMLQGDPQGFEEIVDLAQLCAYVPFDWRDVSPIEQIATMSRKELEEWVHGWMQMMAALIVTLRVWNFVHSLKGHEQSLKEIPHNHLANMEYIHVVTQVSSPPLSAHSPLLTLIALSKPIPAEQEFEYYRFGSEDLSCSYLYRFALGLATQTQTVGTISSTA